MRQIIVLSFLTLDGVRQAHGGSKEDTSGAFQNGGWTAPYGDGVSDKIMKNSCYLQICFWAEKLLRFLQITGLSMRNIGRVLWMSQNTSCLKLCKNQTPWFWGGQTLYCSTTW